MRARGGQLGSCNLLENRHRLLFYPKETVLFSSFGCRPGLFVGAFGCFPSIAAAPCPTLAMAAAKQAGGNQTAQATQVQYSNRLKRKQQSPKGLSNNKEEDKRVEPLRSCQLPARQAPVEGHRLKEEQCPFGSSIPELFPSFHNDELTGTGREQNAEDIHSRNQDTLLRMAALNSSHLRAHLGRHLKPRKIINKLIRTSSKRSITRTR